ncbi:MAG: sulfatase family protein, partial [Planctomycetota bacterium]
YGTTWVDTPAFDRVAREGLLFNNAYTPNAKCAPSRSCILTGRNSWQLEEAANHWPLFPDKFKTYVEALAEHGYHVGKTAKGWAPGIVGNKPDGTKRELAGKGYDKRRAPSPAKGISPSDYAANFVDFLDARPDDAPFCFWYGSTEPHRGYEYGSGVKKGGKKLSDIDKVFDFWPDNEVTRNDMLDYAFEIEHFDDHLGRMIAELEKRGMLENTLIVVTADNGMPFPRIKGQEYELSNHLPLAIMWPRGVNKPGRVIDDYVCFIDFAPTFLEVPGLSFQQVGMHPSPGLSLTDIFNSGRSGIVNPRRDHVLIGKERHDVGRPDDQGYPIRGIVKGGVLYLENFEPERWPAGNPETGYLNTDGSPTKTEILNMRRDGSNAAYWKGSFGKRPPVEMFNVAADRECMTNVSDDPTYAALRAAMKEQMYAELHAQEDPRILGRGYYFDQIIYQDKGTTNFYNRFMKGEELRAGWVNKSDFEREPIE